MSWPLALRTTALRGTAMPFFSSSVLGEHVTNWPARRPRGVAFDGEMNRDRLAAVGEARALIGEREAFGRSAVRAVARLRAGERLEAQRLDPEPRGIDDVEDDRVGWRDLAGDRRAVGDDAGDRRDQRFGLAARLVERGAPVPQALQLEPRSSSCDARHRAARRQACS